MQQSYNHWDVPTLNELLIKLPTTFIMISRFINIDIKYKVVYVCFVRFCYNTLFVYTICLYSMFKSGVALVLSSEIIIGLGSAGRVGKIYLPLTIPI